MGHLMFYLAAVAACLLWSAAFVAAAARVTRPWPRRLLVAVAVVVPVLALAPWVASTAGLAAIGLPANWFVPTFTAFVSALVGGAWIAVAGLSRRSAAGAAAAAWPAAGLAAGFVLAKACAYGTLLFIDNAVTAEGRMLRMEAAQMMAAALPPAPAAADDAAPLYLRAFAALEADTTLREADSPAANPQTADVSSPAVAAILARHAATLDLLRRAADRPGCRFVRDWSRPSIDMFLPEAQSLRRAARLLALAARSEAAAEDAATSLADVVRIHRIGMHVATEPILVSGLVGQAIDTLALQALADVLPRLTSRELPLLNAVPLRDFAETPVSYQRAFLGEEAFGLATLADLADGAPTFLRSLNGAQELAPPSHEPLSLLYRCFLLPADIAGYRGILRRYQSLFASSPPGRPFAEIRDETVGIVDEVKSRRSGIFAVFLAPALTQVVTSQARNQALHAAATVLVAATRARLHTGSLPESAADLVPERLAALPIDPFTTDATLRSKTTDDAWVVYSVGPDGEDDGGPMPPDADPVEGNDDVGLRMAR